MNWIGPALSLALVAPQQPSPGAPQASQPVAAPVDAPSQNVFSSIERGLSSLFEGSEFWCVLIGAAVGAWISNRQAQQERQIGRIVRLLESYQELLRCGDAVAFATVSYFQADQNWRNSGSPAEGKRHVDDAESRVDERLQRFFELMSNVGIVDTDARRVAVLTQMHEHLKGTALAVSEQRYADAERAELSRNVLHALLQDAVRPLLFMQPRLPAPGLWSKWHHRKAGSNHLRAVAEVQREVDDLVSQQLKNQAAKH